MKVFKYILFGSVFLVSNLLFSMNNGFDFGRHWRIIREQLLEAIQSENIYQFRNLMDGIIVASTGEALLLEGLSEGFLAAGYLDSHYNDAIIVQIGNQIRQDNDLAGALRITIGNWQKKRLISIRNQFRDPYSWIIGCRNLSSIIEGENLIMPINGFHVNFNVGGAGWIRSSSDVNYYSMRLIGTEIWYRQALYYLSNHTQAQNMTIDGNRVQLDSDQINTVLQIWFQAMQQELTRAVQENNLALILYLWRTNYEQYNVHPGKNRYRNQLRDIVRSNRSQFFSQSQSYRNSSGTVFDSERRALRELILSDDNNQPIVQGSGPAIRPLPSQNQMSFFDNKTKLFIGATVVAAGAWYFYKNTKTCEQDNKKKQKV